MVGQQQPFNVSCSLGQMSERSSMLLYESDCFFLGVLRYMFCCIYGNLFLICSSESNCSDAVMARRALNHRINLVVLSVTPSHGIDPELFTLARRWTEAKNCSG